jgi:hypothetical protein
VSWWVGGLVSGGVEGGGVGEVDNLGKDGRTHGAVVNINAPTPTTTFAEDPHALVLFSMRAYWHLYLEWHHLWPVFFVFDPRSMLKDSPGMFRKSSIGIQHQESRESRSVSSLP